MFDYRAKICSGYDGDTFRADIDLGFGLWTANQPIRVYGINAPEKNTPEGQSAKEFAATLIQPGLPVTLTTFKDKKEKYGRYLGKITLPDGSDFAAAMLAAGHAKSYFGGTKTP